MVFVTALPRSCVVRPITSAASRVTIEPLPTALDPSRTATSRTALITPPRSFTSLHSSPSPPPLLHVVASACGGSSRETTNSTILGRLHSDRSAATVAADVVASPPRDSILVGAVASVIGGVTCGCDLKHSPHRLVDPPPLRRCRRLISIAPCRCRCCCGWWCRRQQWRGCDVRGATAVTAMPRCPTLPPTAAPPVAAHPHHHPHPRGPNR